MTEEYRKKLDEAADRYREMCPHPDAWATFLAGAQFVLDNPPEERTDLRTENQMLNQCVDAQMSDGERNALLCKIKNLRAQIEALVEAAERANEYVYLFYLDQALAPFRKGEG